MKRIEYKWNLKKPSTGISIKKTKLWINIFRDQFNKDQLYLSHSYGTKKEAQQGIRSSMKDRFIATVNLKPVLAPNNVRKS